MKIIYGLPTPETFEAAERGEGVLGGGCISGINPTRHCNACEKDFGGGNRFSLVDMISFELFIGGFSGTSDSIYIDAKQKNKVVRYATTPGGMHVDLKQPKSELNLNPHMVFKEIPLTSKKWLAFIEELTSLKLACWKDNYYDNDICDGTQWELVIRLPDHNEINKCGSNEYSPGWNKFIKIIKKYVDQKIW